MQIINLDCWPASSTKTGEKKKGFCFLSLSPLIRPNSPTVLEFNEAVTRAKTFRVPENTPTMHASKKKNWITHLPLKFSLLSLQWILRCFLKENYKVVLHITIIKKNRAEIFPYKRFCLNSMQLHDFYATLYLSGDFSNDDGKGSENVPIKMNSHQFFNFVAFIPICWKCQK